MKRTLGVMSGIAAAMMVGYALAPEQASSESKNPPQRLTNQEIRSDGGIILDPPAENSQPNVSADRAIENAQSFRMFASSDANVTATYAKFTNPNIKDIPLGVPDGEEGQFGKPSFVGVDAWVITFDKACVPIFGPVDQTSSGCAGTEWNVVINAQTGEYIQGFSDR